MVNAKDTLNEYDSVRAEGREKLQPLFDEKNKKREALIINLEGATEEEKENARKLYKSQSNRFNEKWNEENKDLITKYQELNEQKKLDEATFQKGLEEFKKIDPKINEEDLREMVMGKLESKETGATTYEKLLNKPNMIAKDKEGMQKSLTYLEENDMLTEENLKDLDAIVYTKEGVKVGPHTRPREDIKAKPNGKNIYQHGDTTYFKWSENMIKEQNKILAKQGMEIPLDSHYEESLQALPGNYKKSNWYKGLNILSFITNMSMLGYCDSDGTLYNEGVYGYRWSASSKDYNSARSFRFDEDEGVLHRNSSYTAFPVRPVLK